MKISSIYRVWVQSAYGGTQWSGNFSEVPEKSNVLEAIKFDILNLNPAVEHEADRIHDYNRLYEVVDHIDRMGTGTTEVTVADVEIGEINVTEEGIFINSA